MRGSETAGRNDESGGSRPENDDRRDRLDSRSLRVRSERLRVCLHASDCMHDQGAWIRDWSNAFSSNVPAMARPRTAGVLFAQRLHHVLHILARLTPCCTPQAQSLRAGKISSEPAALCIHPLRKSPAGLTRPLPPRAAASSSLPFTASNGISRGQVKPSPLLFSLDAPSPFLHEPARRWHS